MAKYRSALPQNSDRLFLTDGGLETTLIFSEGIDLPFFASFDLIRNAEGIEILKKYYRPYLSLARDHRLGFVLDSPTWRANPEWAAKLGYTPEQTKEVNRRAIRLISDLRREFDDGTTEIVLCGCIGPRGDGYVPDRLMTVKEAQDYHSLQISAFAETEADMVGAFTLNYAAEAIGLVEAAKARGLPVSISFTVETNGALPTGQSLKDAIQQVDQATGQGPAYYLVNCAHPTHFENVLRAGGDWTSRLRGVRANASRKSHAELEKSTKLESGNPQDLAADYVDLHRLLPKMNVLGGCCGTDVSHVKAIVERLDPLRTISP